MCNGIKQRLSNLEEAPDFNRFTMALTRKNQAIMGARRQVMYRQNVIERLAERLRERGVLTEDDEQLIATLDAGAGLSRQSIELPSSDEAKLAAIQETRQLLETPQRHPELWGKGEVAEEY